MILAIARWSLQHLHNEPQEKSQKKLSRPDLLVVAFRAVFQPEFAKNVRETYEFRIGDTIFFVKIDDGKLETALGTAEHPVFVFIADPETFGQIVAGSLGVKDAQKCGRVEVIGSQQAYNRCARMFSV